MAELEQRLSDVLAKKDAGFYGQGIYLALEAEYSIEQYGMHPSVHGLTNEPVPLLVCATVCGNTFPVVEMPSGEQTFLGKPIVPKADSHAAIVALGVDANRPLERPWWYPCRPDELTHRAPTYTELVVREASQVLPLGCIVLKKK